MSDRDFRNGRKFGSVKEAINMYGGGKMYQAKNKPQNDASNHQKKASKAPELHLANSRINQINEDRITAESEKSRAESELLKAKKLARELNLQIEESKLRAKEFRKGAAVKKQPAQEDNVRYEDVAIEVEVVKRELSKIKLEIVNAEKEKFRAEKEANAADSRFEGYMHTAENLRAEIEEANEEEVLVELAKIQARKELAEIEAQRKEEEEKCLSLIEATTKKISVLRDEVEETKGLEGVLELTNSDVNVLQNELNLIKEMDDRFRKSQRMKKSSVLQSVAEELNAGKELEAIKEEGIELMLSMDVIRNELINIMTDKGKIKKLEAEKEKYMKKLNAKLLRAKDTLQVSRASEEKAKLMLPSFLLSLKNLEREKEAAMKEEEKVKEETDNIRAEIQKFDSETDINEEKLQAVIEELEAVISAETETLDKLEALAENVVRERASKKKSTITISQYEYDYLMGCATPAREVADKKVAAANAWTEALLASDKEMKVKTAEAEREIEELKLKEAEAVHAMEEAENGAKLATEELQKRRSMKGLDYSFTPAKQAKFRRSVGSPGTRRMSTSTSFNMKRRRKAILKIAKYFANKKIENEKSTPMREDTDNNQLLD